MSSQEYNNYCKDFQRTLWNLKIESIKYCEQDVKVLYQIIERNPLFSEKIFELFNLDIMKWNPLQP
jgi:hypothetical protein